MRKKSVHKPQTMWQTMLTAAAVSLAVAAAFAALIAALVTGGIIRHRFVETSAVIAAGLGALAGAFHAARRAEGKKLVAAAISTAVYLFLLLMGNLLFVDAAPLGIGKIAISSLCAALIAGLLAARGRKRPYGAGRK